MDVESTVAVPVRSVCLDRLFSMFACLDNAIFASTGQLHS